MATSTVQAGARTVDYQILGKDSNGDLYTVIRGTFLYNGTDGQSVAGMLIPVSDASEQTPIGVSLDKTANISVMDSKALAFARFPLVLVTDDSNLIDATNPPEVNKPVYLLDSGKLSDTDTNSSGYALGIVEKIVSGKYYINLLGPDIDT